MMLFLLGVCLHQVSDDTWEMCRGRIGAEEVRQGRKEHGTRDRQYVQVQYLCKYKYRLQ